MSELAIGMIAAPRTAMTIEQTVASLRWGGFREEVRIFAEPGTQIGNLEQVVVHRNSERLGAPANWIGAMRWLLEYTKAPNLLIVEDDVAYCKGARKGLSPFLDTGKPYGFLNLLTPIKESRRLAKAGTGWIQTKWTDVWGTQAVCFSRSTVRGFVEQDTTLISDPRASYDFLVAQYYLDRVESPCYYHVPSLCEHVGWYETTLEKPLGLRSRPEYRHLRRGLGFDPDYVPPSRTGKTGT